MTRRSRRTRQPRQSSRGPRTTPTPHHASAAPTVPRPIRLVAFGVIVLLAGGLAIGLFLGRLQPPAATDVTAVQVHASMGGFDPEALSVAAGQTVRVEFSSMDTPYHSDGGGWHQFAIDALGIDWKVGPQSSEVFEFTAPATPGAYDFYCDICCGGKENPSMQGTLTVTA